MVTGMTLGVTLCHLMLCHLMTEVTLGVTLCHARPRQACLTHS